MEQIADNEKRDSSGTNAVVGELCRFTRLQAVERQLEMAVRARLQYDDPASAMTLVGAAERVLSDLQPRKSIFDNKSLSMRAFIEMYVAKKYRKKAGAHLRAAYDFLRHADKPEKCILELDTYSVDTFLMMAIREFGNQNESITPVMQAFKCWAAANGDDWGFEEVLDSESLQDLRAKANGWSNSALFTAYLSYFESKSPIPYPKSLQNQSQP